MAKNIKINNVTYNSVSAVSVPLAAGGGNAVFPDTSDADASAGDIASGKTAYVNGSKLTGTATGGGGGTPAAVTPKDVNFYDYDGTIVYSYTAAEFAALTALPANPAHDGLTAQGWNYTLSDAKSYVASYGKLDIGQTYITDDGKTRLYIRIATEGRMTVPLYFSQTVANGVTIDWGDGGATQTFAGTGNKNTTHTYAAAGTYEITLDVTSGNLGFGDGTSNYCVMGATSTAGRVYCNMLQSVSIGNSVTSIGNNAFRECYSLASVTIPEGVTSIGASAFYNCYSLASITIPSGVTSIGNNAFYYCYSLASITIPSSVTSIGTYAFYNCSSLASVTIPEGVTSIGTYAFYNCYSLASITIPSGVTSIGNNAFYYCYSLASITIPSGVTSIGTYAFYNCTGMGAYHVLRATPPTLANTNAFTGIPSDCIIYVPAASLAAYKDATNWSTYASYMVGE